MTITGPQLTLLADSITLAVAVTATLRRPILSYKLIVAIALFATGFALHQVVTDCGDLFTLLSTALLVVTMMSRVALNLRGSHPTRRRK